MEEAENPTKSRHYHVNILIMKNQFLKLDDVRENTSKFEELEKTELKEVQGGINKTPGVIISINP